ncbi:MAG: hypothetical protein Q9159_005680 [Coniocarpon cinnabarinum]
MSHAPKTLYVAIIGATGGVGKAFVSQLEALSHKQLQLPEAKATPLSLVYASRSAKALVREYHHPIKFSTLETDLNTSTTPPLQATQLAEFLSKAPGRAVVVDNTSSQEIAEAYPLYLQNGISVITPNKKAFSADLPLWDGVFGSAANGDAPNPATAGFVYHEPTVGACLPVICTLKDLIDTGDIVERVEGVFSGTMSFLFNTYMASHPHPGAGDPKFSAEVRKAKDLGFTEPDPRDDLNGLDVARKLTILARLCGLRVQSPTSFPVQSLIPKELESCRSGEEFMSRLPEFDHEIDALKKEAEAEHKVLRYVGSADLVKGELEVGLRKYDPSSPIGGLKGAASVISFKTKRYVDPLVVQGAGAGGELTAMGVTADLIRVMERLR